MALVDHFYILLTVFLNVYTQLILKWQVSKVGAFPADANQRLLFLVRLLFNPWILSGIAATFIGMLSWFNALSKFQLSYAYPFVGLTFIAVFAGSAIWFHESVSLPKIIGFAFIVVGILFISQG